MQNVNTPSLLTERALRIRDVCSRTGLSRTHLYRLIAHGLFPNPTRLSERVSVWRESDINHWLHQKFSLAKTVGSTVMND